MYGQGHGAAFLRRRALQLRAAGAPTVAIDPDVRNLHARRACVSASFRDAGEVDTPEGKACLLVFDE